MFYRLLLRLYVIALLLVLIAIGTDAATNLFGEEKLYPVENFVGVRDAELSQPAILRSKLSANPFIPAGLPEVPEVSQPNLDETAELAYRFDKRGFIVEVFASEPGPLDIDKVNHCKASIEQTLSALPVELTQTIEKFRLFFSRRSPRGLSNSRTVELRCLKLSESEIISVLVHELGHSTDLGYLRGNSLAPSKFSDGQVKIPADDSSVRFYQLSWRDEATQRFVADRKDFVSGYAMSDCFEDFAESFNFYVLHGKDFRALKNESSTLEKKYAFLRDEIFSGIEFESERVTQAEQRVWDTTLLPFDHEEFFARSKNEYLANLAE
ncbi:MAG: hypothetical protein ABIH35_04115 [Patescibacteria group bacterium]